jgi:predicted Zn-ribbon and HTH transcriptional regulator
MPDLTIEHHWTCAPMADWANTPPRLRRNLGMRPPACRWTAYTDGEAPRTQPDGTRVCPKCGSPVTSVAFGV